MKTTMTDEEFLRSLKISPWPMADNYKNPNPINLFPDETESMTQYPETVEDETIDPTLELDTIHYQQQVTQELIVAVQEFLSFSTPADLIKIINQYL